MKFLTFLALALVFAACTDGPADTATQTNSRPPAEMLLGTNQQALRLDDTLAEPFELTTLDGDRITYEDLRGRVVLINFWATWCSPCIREMPDLAELSRDLADEPFLLIGAALEDADEAAIRTFVERLQIPYPIAIDEGAVADALGGVYMMPTTYLLDKQGRRSYRFIGVVEPDTLRKEIDRLLGA